MRLEITRKADLATRALVVLDRASGRVKAGELADVLGTTSGFVPQVIAPLIEQSWVRSDPGPTGGYRSTVDLAGLSVLDVIEAVEGPTDTGRCVVEDRPCDGGGPCALHAPWAKARRRLLIELSDTPLTSVPVDRPAVPT